MALNWSSVKAEHVEAAFKLLAQKRSSIKRHRGLVVHNQGVAFPAKEVLRVAYRLANAVPENTEVKFSSGDGTLHTLQKLGFTAERVE